MDDWILLVVLLGSIIALTALVTIIVRRKFKGSVTLALASILGLFAGISGASHGLSEILQGNIAPSGILIEAWPELTSLGGEPDMTFIPNFSVTGIVTVITGVAVTIWAATRIQSKNGGLVLILLSIMMLLVGGGLIPPALEVMAGIMGSRVRQKDLKASRQKV